MIEVQKSRLGFVVKSKSGRVLLQSVEFTTKTEIERNIKQLNSFPKLLTKVERKTNFDGKFLFSVKNSDNKIIGRSELYSSEAGMENGIKNLAKNITKL